MKKPMQGPKNKTVSQKCQQALKNPFLIQLNLVIEIKKINAMSQKKHDKKKLIRFFKPKLIPYLEQIRIFAKEYLLPVITNENETSNFSEFVFNNIKTFLNYLQKYYKILGEYEKRRGDLKKLLEFQEKQQEVLKQLFEFQEKRLKVLKLQKKDSVKLYRALVNTCWRLGNLSYDLKAFKEAEVCYERALKFSKAHYGEQHLKVGKLCYNLAGLFYRLGALEPAKEHYCEALKILKKHYETADSTDHYEKDEHPALAKIYQKLVGLYPDFEQLNRAEACYNNLLEAQKKYYGENNPELALTYLSSGHVMRRRADFYHIKKCEALRSDNFNEAKNHATCELDKLREVEDYYYKIVVLLEKPCNRQQYSVLATAHHHLGNVAYTLGMINCAQESYHKALKLFEQYCEEPYYPVWAAAYVRLGNIAYASDKRKQARSFYEKALEVFRKHYGEEHPEFVDVYHSLGDLALDFGEMNKAEKYLKLVLELYKKYYNNHPRFSSVYNSLGLLNREMGKLKAAKKHYEQVLKLDTKRLGKDSPELSVAYTNLSIVTTDLGDGKKAEVYCQKALAILEKYNQRDHPVWAWVHLGFGKAARQLGKLDKAIEYYKKALPVFKKSYSENHPAVLTVIIEMNRLIAEASDLKNIKLETLQDAFLKANAAYKKLCQHKYVGKDHPKTEYAGNLLNEIQLRYQIAKVNQTGISHCENKQYAKAIGAFEKTMKILSKLEVLMLYNLGNTYLLNQQFKLAIFCFNQCLDIKKKKLQQTGNALDEIKQKIIQVERILLNKQLLFFLLSLQLISKKVYSSRRLRTLLTGRTIFYTETEKAHYLFYLIQQAESFYKKLEPFSNDKEVARILAKIKPLLKEIKNTQQGGHSLSRTNQLLVMINSMSRQLKELEKDKVNSNGLQFN